MSSLDHFSNGRLRDIDRFLLKDKVAEASFAEVGLFAVAGNHVLFVLLDIARVFGLRLVRGVFQVPVLLFITC